MARAFTPHPYQRLIINHQLDVKRNAVWAGMGLGKTVSTLNALNILEVVEPCKTLVLAPLRVAASTWPDEVKKWDNLKNLEVSPIVGDTTQRKAALRKDANIYTLNYDNLPWLVETLGDKWPFTRVIADESTRLKSFRLRQGGKRAQALAKVAHTKVTHFSELTGTPSPNGLEDLWGQLWFIDRGERLGRSYSAYISRWFQTINLGEFSKTKPLPFAQEQIQEKLADICLSIEAKDWFNLQEPIQTTVYVDLPSKVRDTYKQFEREMLMSIGDSEIEALNAAAKTVKCLQLANGAVYTSEQSDTWTEVHDTKLQALESIVNESGGMPVLVAYHFKSDLARLLKAFPKGRHLDSDPKTIRDWNAGKIPILFAHPASAGHGLNLQDGGNILVFFAHWWDLEQYQQIVERIGPTRQKQAGYDRPVFIYHIVARGTVDETVMLRRETKRTIQDLLLEAMKGVAP